MLKMTVENVNSQACRCHLDGLDSSPCRTGLASLSKVLSLQAGVWDLVCLSHQAGPS